MKLHWFRWVSILGLYCTDMVAIFHITDSVEVELIVYFVSQIRAVAVFLL